MLGAIAFTAIAWLLWFACLSPFFAPYLISPKARRTKVAFFAISALVLLVAAAALGFVYFFGGRLSHRGTLVAAAVLSVGSAVQARNGLRTISRKSNI